MSYILEALGGPPASFGFRDRGAGRSWRGRSSRGARSRPQPQLAHRSAPGRPGRRPRLRPRADARGRASARSLRATRVGGADGLRIRRLLRLRCGDGRVRETLHNRPCAMSRQVAILNARAAASRRWRLRGGPEPGHVRHEDGDAAAGARGAPPRVGGDRVWMLNSIGLQNPGIDGLEQAPLRACASSECRSGLRRRLLGPDYALVCERLDEIDAVEAMELDLSCPNVDEAPRRPPSSSPRRGERPRSRSTRSCRRRRRTSRRPRARSPPRARTGLSLVNTIRGVALDPKSLRPRHRAGGRRSPSGPRLLPIALTASMPVRARSICPSWAWAECLRSRRARTVAAGRRAVALGTVLFSDPFAAVRVRAESRDELARSRGSLERPRSGAPRANPSPSRSPSAH